ncbi:MAG: amidohydrolase family protein, partial [Oscillospiraceae bacterium]|nr:amidohydrolase family protein [Oscillospiraceae bacterium]
LVQNGCDLISGVALLVIHGKTPGMAEQNQIFLICKGQGLGVGRVCNVGAEKVLYATDAPMQGYRFIQGAVLAADISDAEKKLILRDNAARLLGLQ